MKVCIYGVGAIGGFIDQHQLALQPFRQPPQGLLRQAEVGTGCHEFEALRERRGQGRLEALQQQSRPKSAGP